MSASSTTGSRSRVLVAFPDSSISAIRCGSPVSPATRGWLAYAPTSCSGRSSAREFVECSRTCALPGSRIRSTTRPRERSARAVRGARRSRARRPAPASDPSDHRCNSGIGPVENRRGGRAHRHDATIGDPSAAGLARGRPRRVGRQVPQRPTCLLAPPAVAGTVDGHGRIRRRRDRSRADRRAIG